MTTYDVIIIGGGPGGYVAAIRAAKEGKKTALVEADLLGGTCLNRGCIPSKTLLKHAEIIEQIEKAQQWGIQTSTPVFDLSKMLARKDEVITSLRNGIKSLLQAGEIDLYKGLGTLLPNKRVIVDQESETVELRARKVIIATGSRPLVPPIDGLDQISYHTTDSIFDIDHIPKSLAIVGGGVIGVELASIFSSLQTEVTIIELGERIISSEDEAASKVLLKSLKKKGIKVKTGHQVNEVHTVAGSKVKRIKITKKNGEQFNLDVEDLLIAVGRRPNVESVKESELAMNGPFIQVNDYMETSEKDVFAVGDVIGNWQLAHAASSEGLAAIANLETRRIKVDNMLIPRCIYTSPQVASVGMTEVELKTKGIPYEVHSFNFSGNGMSLATGETEGFSKIMIDKEYGEILGVVMVGAHVTEIISQSTAFMKLEGTIDELATMVQPHPSLSEALMESANALIEKGIHV